MTAEVMLVIGAGTALDDPIAPMKASYNRAMTEQ